jgi:hypothetical protein
MRDDMGRACTHTGCPRRTGRVVCWSPPGRHTPPGWWVLWDGTDTPRWEPASTVRVDDVTLPRPRTIAPAVGPAPVFADALAGTLDAVAKADR